MAMKGSVSAAGTRAGIRLAVRRPSNGMNQASGDLRTRNAMGMQAFEANPDVQRAKRTFGQIASPVLTERRTPSGQYVTPSMVGLVHQRAVARTQTAAVARHKALALGRQDGAVRPNPTPTDLMVADHQAAQAVRASDEEYGAVISNTLTALRAAVDDVEAAHPPATDSLLANLPPGRVEQLRLFAEMAHRGSVAQFVQRADEVIAANDRPAYVVLTETGRSLIDEDGKFAHDPNRQKVEATLARLDLAFATPKTKAAQVAQAWVARARQDIGLLQRTLAQPDAENLLPAYFQTGTFVIWHVPPADADAAWYAQRFDQVLAAAVTPSASLLVLQPSGRLAAGDEVEAEAEGPVQLGGADRGSRGT